MDVIVIEVRPEQAESAFKLMKDEIESAVLYHGDGKYNVDDVLKGVQLGNFKMFLLQLDEVKSVAIFNLIDINGHKILNVFIYAGEWDRIHVFFLKLIDDLGKSQGCESVYLHGRKGWERKLKPHDYKFRHVVLEKVIDYG